MGSKPLVKRFDKELYKEWDAKSKDVTKEMLLQIGFEDVKENDGESSGDFSNGFWDLEAGLNGERFRFESEVKIDDRWKTRWKSVLNKQLPFPFHSLHIAARKNKNDADFFIVIHQDLDLLIWVKSKDVKSSTIVRKKWFDKNRRTYQLGDFFEIILPSPGMRVYQKVEEKWEKIRQWDENGRFLTLF